MPTIQAIQLDISKLKNLPALPKESGRILVAINNPDIELDDLVSILATSPILMARLLGLANSAYFGYAGTVKDLRVAVIHVLGLKLVKSLSLSVLLNMSLDSTKCTHFDSERFWHNALLTAVCAQKIATRLKRENLDPSFSYTAGILLHIGLLAIVYIYPEEMDSLLLLEKKDERSLNELIKQYYAVDQYQVGGYLLKRWQLPVAYQEVVKFYKNTGYSGTELPTINLLKVASLLVKMIHDNNDEFSPDTVALLQSLDIDESLLLSVKAEVSDEMKDFNALVYVVAGK